MSKLGLHNLRVKLRQWVGQATEPHILYPAIAVVVLGVIWGSTLNLIEVERETAERTAAVSSFELAETYEAQVLRALREIDQTLKVVKYAYEHERNSGADVLEELKANALLPPDLLFTVSIVDRDGAVVSSTRPLGMAGIADQDYFQSHLQGEALAVSRPGRAAGYGEWTLRFTRRLDAAGGTFAGVAMVSVGADYFVSAYDATKLGESGVLGLVGTDGVFRAKRIGEEVTAGDVVDYAAVVAAWPTPDSQGRVQISPWDGIRRYTSARELYDFPLAVIVGLSVEEQSWDTRLGRQAYMLRAFVGSVLLVVIVTVLGRMSRQLASSRALAVDEQIAHAARVEYLAYHDALTGLPNRSMFSRMLGQSLNEARRYQRKIAVLFLDLDRFKSINDTLGHEAGDQLLREVATRLRQCLRDSDTVARLGGDEFVALLPHLDEEIEVSTVAQKILSAVARPFTLLGHEFRITASVGISIYPQDGLDEQTLTKNADIAMYQAKEAGKNNYQFYSEALNASSLERLALESGLRHALDRGEFQLHYQAKHEMATGRITGMEALLRWQHPDLGIVAPMQFLSVAEETGLIVPIGKWVIKTVCAQNVAWQNQGLPAVSIAVNMTSRQFFDENLLRDLASILAESRMPPNLLELEITESLLMHDVDRTLSIFMRLKDLGVRIAIDDFGIGYASLATLHRFPLDTIKIDRSFIRDGGSVDADKDVTGAIIAMGRTLSMTVVAQGVETREQADFLRQNACDQCQGFYFNKPVAADDIARLLRAQLMSSADSPVPLGG